MEINVLIQSVTPRRLAAVQRRVQPGAVASAWRPALDQVWAFLREHPGLHAGGHNVFLYRHPSRRGEPMEVDFGVEVSRSFTPAGEVRETMTPAGEVAVAVHRGPYSELHRVHAAIGEWAKANRRALGDYSWEVYGDWSDDPARLETTVLCLLA